MRVFWDVDTQVDFMTPTGRLYVQGAEQIAPVLGALTRFAHANGIRILASSDDHGMDDEELSERPDGVTTFPPHCLRGTEGQRRIPETQLHNPLVVEPKEAFEGVGSHDGDVLFHKHFFDVFTNRHVEGVIEELGVSDVVLYGVALDVCNRFAVEGLLNRFPAISISIVVDAVRALDTATGELLLASWESRGVKLLTTKEVLASA